MCVELKRRWFERAWAVGLAPGSEGKHKGDDSLCELADDKGNDTGESEKA